MRAELLKIRRLPTPALLLALVLLAPAVAAAIVYIVKPDDPAWYHVAPMTTAATTCQIAAVVFGVWLIGIEFAQGTLRRALTAEPRRVHLVLNKLVVVTLVTLGAAALSALIAYWLGALAADLRSVDYDAGTAAKLGVVLVIGTVLVALLSFALGLLSESLTGGIVLAFAVLFVLNGVLSFVRAIRDYTFGAALDSISDAVDPDTASALGLWGGIGVALAWVAVLMVPALYRFSRSDF
ncbi:MAG: ABC transporter permease, partial [Thermoleophilia bacterium]